MPERQTRSVLLVYSRTPSWVDCYVAVLTALWCCPPAIRQTMRQRRLPSWPTPPLPGPHRPARWLRGTSFVVTASIGLSPYPQPVRSGSLAAAASTFLLLQSLWCRRTRRRRMPCSSLILTPILVLAQARRLFVSSRPHGLIVVLLS